MKIRIAEKVAVQSGKLSVLVNNLELHDLLSDASRAMIHKAVLPTEEQHRVYASDNVAQVGVTQFQTSQVRDDQTSTYRSTKRASPTQGNRTVNTSGHNAPPPDGQHRIGSAIVNHFVRLCVDIILPSRVFLLAINPVARDVGI